MTKGQMQANFWQERHGDGFVFGGGLGFRVRGLGFRV